MSRFDYVKYDEGASDMQAMFKNKFQELDGMVERHLFSGRERSLVHTKLEEAYMWVGKSIRDDQIIRNKKTTLQEERTNS